ncbi:C40 family peptidase [Bacillus velezensis]|uniref:C40 family peptidase n=1 Tax=Bacillus velezensis TaxID=492670 RepID=UPI000BA72C89|nr:C40 family peptidase [Bacillus velezensis]PAF02225.1 peptidase [Bacillus velezensis]
MRAAVTAAAANVWTLPSSPRSDDAPMLENPPQIRKWLASMGYEERLQLCTDNLVQTQALFGEEVIILKEEGEWAFVAVPGQPSNKDARGYPGWMKKNQLSKDGFHTSSPAVWITKPTAFLYHTNGEPDLEVSFLTRLPAPGREKGFFRVVTPLGERFVNEADADECRHTKGRAADVIETGMMFLGLPYLWGGLSGFGFDCSGFMYSIFKANGYTLPRDAKDQAKAGCGAAVNDIRPADLLFFAYEEGKGAIHHVGLALGDGRMLHSPKTGKTIEVLSLEGTVYEKELCTVRRCISEKGE